MVQSCILSPTIFDISGPNAVFSLVPLASLTVHLCVPARLFAWQTESLARTLCSWNSPLLKREPQTQIMWLSWTGFLAGLIHQFQMCTLNSFSCSNTNTLIHSCKKAALQSWGLQKFIQFFQVLASGGPGFWWKPGLRFLLWPPPWVVNLLSGHHSRLPLVIRKKWSAAEEACQDIFWTCWISVRGSGSGQQTCYVNDSRVTEMCWEENLNS